MQYIELDTQTKINNSNSIEISTNCNNNYILTQQSNIYEKIGDNNHSHKIVESKTIGNMKQNIKTNFLDYRTQ